MASIYDAIKDKPKSNSIFDAIKNETSSDLGSTTFPSSQFKPNTCGTYARKVITASGWQGNGIEDIRNSKYASPVASVDELTAGDVVHLKRAGGDTTRHWAVVKVDANGNKTLNELQTVKGVASTKTDRPVSAVANRIDGKWRPHLSGKVKKFVAPKESGGNTASKPIKADWLNTLAVPNELTASINTTDRALAKNIIPVAKKKAAPISVQSLGLRTKADADAAVIDDLIKPLKIVGEDTDARATAVHEAGLGLEQVPYEKPEKRDISRDIIDVTKNALGQVAYVGGALTEAMARGGAAMVHQSFPGLLPQDPMHPMIDEQGNEIIPPMQKGIENTITVGSMFIPGGAYAKAAGALFGAQVAGGVLPDEQGKTQIPELVNGFTQKYVDVYDAVKTGDKAKMQSAAAEAPWILMDAMMLVHGGLKLTRKQVSTHAETRLPEFAKSNGEISRTGEQVLRDINRVAEPATLTPEGQAIIAKANEKLVADGYEPIALPEGVTPAQPAEVNAVAASAAPGTQPVELGVSAPESKLVDAAKAEPVGNSDTLPPETQKAINDRLDAKYPEHITEQDIKSLNDNPEDVARVTSMPVEQYIEEHGHLVTPNRGREIHEYATQVASKTEPSTSPIPEVTHQAERVEPIENVDFEPERFQYKESNPPGNVPFNAQWADAIDVWRDPADGRLKVVDGHKRYPWAVRDGETHIKVREVDGLPDVASARVYGALKNITQGTGTATDAARLFRETGFTQAELLDKGIDIKAGLARTANGLAKLNDTLWNDVTSGRITEKRGALIGDMIPDANDQALFSVSLRNQEAKGQSITDAKLVDIINDIRIGASAGGEQTGFGFIDDNMVNRAHVTDYVRTELKKNSKVLARAVKDRVQLERGGNVIDADTSTRIAKESEQIGELFDTLRNQKGEIADIINAGVRRLANGEELNTVRSDIYNEVATKIQEAITGGEIKNLVGSGEQPRINTAGVDKPAGKSEPAGTGAELDTSIAEKHSPPTIKQIQQIESLLDTRDYSSIKDQPEMQHALARQTKYSLSSNQADKLIELLKQSPLVTTSKMPKKGFDVGDEIYHRKLGKGVVVASSDSVNNLKIKYGRQYYELFRRDSSVNPFETAEGWRITRSPKEITSSGKPKQTAVPVVDSKTKFTKIGNPAKKLSDSTIKPTMPQKAVEGGLFGESQGGLFEEKTKESVGAYGATDSAKSQTTNAIAERELPSIKQAAPTQQATKEIANPVSERDVVKAMLDGANMFYRKGRMGATSAVGQFKERLGIGRAKDIYDIPTASHEVGHKLGYDNEWTKDQSLLDELEPFANPDKLGGQSSWMEGGKQDVKLREGIAEYVRHWITDPAMARSEAPLFTEKFELALAENGTLQQFVHAQELYADYLAQGGVNKLRAATDYGNKVARKIEEQPLWHGFRTEVVDDIFIFRKDVESIFGMRSEDVPPSLNPHIKGHLARGFAAEADEILNEAKSIIHKSGDKSHNATNFQDYARARALKNYAENERPTGVMTNADIAEVIAKYDSPRFRKAYDEIQDVYANLLEIEKNFRTPESRAKMAENKNYISMNRVIEHGIGETSEHGAGLGTNSKSMANQKIVDHQYKGKSHALYEPWTDTLVRRIYTSTQRAKLNDALISYVDMLTNSPSHAREAERIPPSKLPVNIGKMLETAIGDMKNGKELIDSLPEEIFDLEYWRDMGLTSKMKDSRIVFVMRDGKPEFYQIASKIRYDAIMGMAPKGIDNVILKAMNSYSNFIRAAVVSDPGFLLYSNLVRDSLSSWFVTPGFVPFYDTLANIPGAIKGGKEYTALAKSGGAMAGTAALDRATVRKQASALTTHTPAKEEVQKARDSSEMTNRIAVYKRELAYAEKKHPEWSTQDKSDYASWRSRDLLNFSMKGRRTQDLTRSVAFLRSSINGMAKVSHEIKINPLRVVKVGTIMSAATALLYYQNRNDKDYQALDEYERNNYWHIKIPGSREFTRIPKNHEWSLAFATASEDFLRMLDGDETAFKGFQNAVYSTVLKDPTPDALQTLMDVAGNTDGFTHQSIVPNWLASGPSKVRPEDQFKPETSPTAKAIGKGLGRSPAKIEYIFKQALASLGDPAVNLVDRVTSPLTGEGPKRSINLTKRMMTSVNAYPDAYNRLEDAANTVEMDYNSIKQIKGRPDSKERNNRAKELGYKNIEDLVTKAVRLNAVLKSMRPLQDAFYKEGATQKEKYAARDAMQAQSRKALKDADIHVAFPSDSKISGISMLGRAAGKNTIKPTRK